MNRAGAIIMLCLILGGIGAAYDQYLARPPVRDEIVQTTRTASQGKPASDFSFTDMQGKSHHLADFRGKWIVLDFWATWCTPCVVTFPSLMKFAAAYQDKVVVLALSSDRNIQQVKAFIAKQSPETRHNAEQANVLIAIDEGMHVTKDLYYTQKYPETILIDPELRIVKKLVGATDWQSAEITAWADSAFVKSVK